MPKGLLDLPRKCRFASELSRQALDAAIQLDHRRIGQDYDPQKIQDFCQYLYDLLSKEWRENDTVRDMMGVLDISVPEVLRTTVAMFESTTNFSTDFEKLIQECQKGPVQNWLELEQAPQLSFGIKDYIEILRKLVNDEIVDTDQERAGEMVRDYDHYIQEGQRRTIDAIRAEADAIVDYTDKLTSKILIFEHMREDESNAVRDFLLALSKVASAYDYIEPIKF